MSSASTPCSQTIPISFRDAEAAALQERQPSPPVHHGGVRRRRRKASPQHGADRRRHDRHPPPAVPRAEHLAAHPATAVKRRGPKSRAGLIAYPELKPKAAPMATTSNPTSTGPCPAAGGALRLSVSAKMTADEQRRADHLVDEPSRKRAQKRLRIGRPDSGSAVCAADHARAPDRTRSTPRGSRIRPRPRRRTHRQAAPTV